jgi:hypothetical protein
VWWQPVFTADAGIRTFLEYHNQTGFFISVRAGRFSADLRDLQINPENTITIPTTGRVDIILKRLL